jgi:hypothetical protein
MLEFCFDFQTLVFMTLHDKEMLKTELMNRPRTCKGVAQAFKENPAFRSRMMGLYKQKTEVQVIAAVAVRAKRLLPDLDSSS